MKARSVLLSALSCLSVTLSAAAQTAPARPLVRADVLGAVGWAHVHDEQSARWDQWDHRVAHASGAFGWYWSDHLKTEVEVDTASKATFYRYDYIETPGQYTYRSSRFETRGASIAVVQHYQFLRNAWLHPFVGAGLELRHEQRAEQVEPVTIHDAAVREPRVLEPARRVEWPDRWHARGVAEGGVKAYVSRRTFARLDVKVVWRGGVDEIVLRAGVGVDF